MRKLKPESPRVDGKQHGPLIPWRHRWSWDALRKPATVLWDAGDLGQKPLRKGGKNQDGVFPSQKFSEFPPKKLVFHGFSWCFPSKKAWCFPMLCGLQWPQEPVAFRREPWEFPKMVDGAKLCECLDSPHEYYSSLLYLPNQPTRKISCYIMLYLS